METLARPGNWLFTFTHGVNNTPAPVLWFLICLPIITYEAICWWLGTPSISVFFGQHRMAGSVLTLCIALAVLINANTTPRLAAGRQMSAI